MLSWVRVGASWCVLGASWGVLGVSYRRLRPDLGTSWGYFLIVLVPVSGYSGDGKRFCEVVCVRRLEAERLDGFNFVGRAQRASDASGALGRFCDPPAFFKACANASSLRMLSKVRDDYGRHAKHAKRSSL